MKRGAVISGGGAKGAWAIGVLQYLYNVKAIKWDYTVGTSTGGLIAPLVLVGDIDRLQKAYTGITNDKIYSVNPWTKKNKLNIFNAAWRILRHKTSFGEAGKLRKLIETFYRKQDHDYINSIRSEGKLTEVCVTNLSYKQAEFKDTSYSYKTFCDFMLATASVPIAFDIVKLFGSEYLDGGIIHHVPIQRAIDLGCSEIDIIILRPENPIIGDEWKANNMLDVIERVIDIALDELSIDDVIIAKLLAEKKDVKLNFYYTPTVLTNNSIVFDPKQMQKWVRDGWEYAKYHGPTKSIILKKHGK